MRDKVYIPLLPFQMIRRLGSASFIRTLLMKLCYVILQPNSPLGLVWLKGIQNNMDCAFFTIGVMDGFAGFQI